jgi:hypothetical protein
MEVVWMCFDVLFFISEFHKKCELNYFNYNFTRLYIRYYEKFSRIQRIQSINKQTDVLIAEADGIIAKMDSLIAGLDLPAVPLSEQQQKELDKQLPDVTCARLSTEVFVLDGVITETPDWAS